MAKRGPRWILLRSWRPCLAGGVPRVPGGRYGRGGTLVTVRRSTWLVPVRVVTASRPPRRSRRRPRGPRDSVTRCAVVRPLACPRCASWSAQRGLSARRLPGRGTPGGDTAVGSVAVAAGTGFLAAGSPLTGLVHGAPTGRAAATCCAMPSVRCGRARAPDLRRSVCGRGMVAMFAVLKGQGYYPPAALRPIPAAARRVGASHDRNRVEDSCRDRARQHHCAQSRRRIGGRFGADRRRSNGSRPRPPNCAQPSRSGRRSARADANATGRCESRVGSACSAP